MARLTARATTITSGDNRWLKRFRQALLGQVEAGDNYVGVEGVRLVEEALRSGLEIAALLVSSAGERHLERLAARLPEDSGAMRVFRTSDRLFAGVADTRTPQGVAALVRPRRAAFDDLLRGGVPLVVVLVGVQDPGNVGTILRSAEAFGATGGVATRGTANPLAPKALRASAGSALRLPIATGVSVPILLAQLRVAGLKLYAACPEPAEARSLRPEFLSRTGQAASRAATLLPAEADLRGPAALLIGNEGAGLPPEVERSVDARIRIPLTAAVDSLNAAVAASVLLYEAARQRGLAT